MTVFAWAIGEGHRRARVAIVEGLQAAVGLHPSEFARLLSLYGVLAGDTHTVCMDWAGEVFEGQIDRSGRRCLH